MQGASRTLFGRLGIFETPTVDLSVYAVAILVLSITGLGACLLPALRASRLDARLALNEQ